MASFRASDTFFQIRRYLRNLGETDMNLFAVQCENETYTISEWDYPEHPRPDASHLSEITTHQIQEERKSMIREHHTIDICTYRVNKVLQLIQPFVAMHAVSYPEGKYDLQKKVTTELL